MGFIAEPNLPDFKKLQLFLNSSGIQKWNPPLYDILARLIAANNQSQDVLANTTIPNATATVTVTSGIALSGDGSPASPLDVQVDGGNVTVNGSNQLTSKVQVDSAGALTGDGSTGSKLAVAVDGVTVTIVGDQLVASSGAILQSSTNFTNGQILALNSAPIKVISGISNKIIVPIATIWRATNTTAFNLSRSANLVYNSGGAAAITASFPSSLNSSGAYSSNAGVGSPSALKSPDNAIGSDVYLLGNADNTGGGVANIATLVVFYGIQG